MNSENNVENNVENTVESTVESTVENTVESTVENNVENVMVGGGKKSFFELYTVWIKKYKFSLFAFVTIISIYIAHTQESFIKIANIIRKN